MALGFTVAAASLLGHPLALGLAGCLLVGLLVVASVVVFVVVAGDAIRRALDARIVG